jgi:hypothetical protein
VEENRDNPRKTRCAVEKSTCILQLEKTLIHNFSGKTLTSEDLHLARLNPNAIAQHNESGNLLVDKNISKSLAKGHQSNESKARLLSLIAIP